MIRPAPVLAFLGFTALVAACATPSTDTAALPARNVCAQIDALYAAGQRESFTLDFPDAERRFREILALQDATPEAAACRGGASPATTHAELGLALSSQRRFRLAEAAFDDAARSLAARAPATPAETQRVQIESGRVDALRAQHALNLRDFAAAERESASAIERLDPAGAGEIQDLGGVLELAAEDRARRLSGLSSLYASSAAGARGGDTEAARSAIAEALDIASTLPGATGALRSRLLIETALVELIAGRPEVALISAREAADQLEAELPATPLAARARLLEGVAMARLARREDALAAFEQAFDGYAENPAELQYESIWPYLKLVIEAEREGAMDERAMSEGVFRAAQLIRSASAASDIAQTAALFGAESGPAATAVRDWRDAQEALLLFSTALSRRDLADYERVALNAQFVEAARVEARLRDRRDALAPGYAAAVERPVTLAEVQAALGAGEALLQIMVGAPRSTLIYVEPDRVRVRTARIDGATAGAITQILRSAMSLRPGGVYEGFNVDGAYLVFNELLGDLGAEIAASPGVFVSVTGALQALPLEVLVTRDPADQAAAVAQGDYRGVAWLGAQTELSYLPAPRNLVDLRGRAGTSAAPSPVIGFGGYDPSGDPAAAINERRRQSCAQEVGLLRRMPPLPGTRQELVRIEQAFAGGNVEIVTGDAFTEDAVKRLSGEGRLRDYRIVHFATHGLLWPSADCFDPALTANVAAGSTEDALLESAEIRLLDLDAQLVVLSACESTDVEIAGAGENLSGLARAFFTSGARSVVASHWKVEDVATAELMGAFYDALAADPTTPFGTALRAAQDEIRSRLETSHPVFWAPFVVIGDGQLSLRGGGV